MHVEVTNHVRPCDHHATPDIAVICYPCVHTIADIQILEWIGVHGCLPSAQETESAAIFPRSVWFIVHIHVPVASRAVSCWSRPRFTIGQGVIPARFVMPWETNWYHWREVASDRALHVIGRTMACAFHSIVDVAGTSGESAWSMAVASRGCDTLFAMTSAVPVDRVGAELSLPRTPPERRSASILWPGSADALSVDADVARRERSDAASHNDTLYDASVRREALVLPHPEDGPPRGLEPFGLAAIALPVLGELR